MIWHLWRRLEEFGSYGPGLYLQVGQQVGALDGGAVSGDRRAGGLRLLRHPHRFSHNAVQPRQQGGVLLPAACRRISTVHVNVESAARANAMHPGVTHCCSLF